MSYYRSWEQFLGVMKDWWLLGEAQTLLLTHIELKNSR